MEIPLNAPSDQSGRPAKRQRSDGDAFQPRTITTSATPAPANNGYQGTPVTYGTAPVHGPPGSYVSQPIYEHPQACGPVQWTQPAQGFQAPILSPAHGISSTQGFPPAQTRDPPQSLEYAHSPLPTQFAPQPTYFVGPTSTPGPSPKPGPAPHGPPQPSGLAPAFAPVTTSGPSQTIDLIPTYGPPALMGSSSSSTRQGVTMVNINVAPGTSISVNYGPSSVAGPGASTSSTPAIQPPCHDMGAVHEAISGLPLAWLQTFAYSAVRADPVAGKDLCKL